MKFNDDDFMTVQSKNVHEEINHTKLNVILVGTKLDIALKQEFRREVKFEEAMELA